MNKYKLKTLFKELQPGVTSVWLSEMGISISRTSNGFYQLRLTIDLGYDLYTDNTTFIYIFTDKHEIKVENTVGSPKFNQFQQSIT